jgi:starch synthase
MTIAAAPSLLHNTSTLVSGIQGPDRSTLRIETSQENKKKILLVTSEMAGLVKTGGLGDVSAALPRALRAVHDVRVLIPGYPQVLNSGNHVRIVGELSGNAAIPAAKIGRIDIEDGLIVYVVICPELYEREGNPYMDTQGRDWADNHIRFGRLGLAAADIAAGTACIRWCPDLVHANDWQAGLAPAYMRWRGQKTPTVFTIHNLAYQGVLPIECARELAIPDHAIHMDHMELNGQLSFLKAGIAYADQVTTVSATYAREITTPAFGCGLEGFLKVMADAGKLSGIINGIDESWDSETDPRLVGHFTADDWRERKRNTEFVRERFNLAPSRGPLFSVVSRLVYQKGLDLTLAAVQDILDMGGQLVITGCGEPHVEQAVRELQEQYPGQIGVHVGFDETEARRIFAGSDFLLMPSRYEPCGLSQMYAQCYGALPIARRTGGLADTIQDGVDGFLFDGDFPEYRDAIQRAFRVFSAPWLFAAMRTQAMTTPLYWHQSIEPYTLLYQQLLATSNEGLQLAGS